MGQRIFFCSPVVLALAHNNAPETDGHGGARVYVCVRVLCLAVCAGAEKDARRKRDSLAGPPRRVRSFFLSLE